MGLRRRPHILRPLTSSLQRLRIVFFDVETVTVEETDKRLYQGFKLCTANVISYRPGGKFINIKNFKTRNELSFHSWFMDLLYKRANLFVISANIWFDIRNSGLFLHLLNSGFNVKLFLDKGFTLIIKLARGSQSITFLNMQQFIPVSVKEMGELVGLAKEDINLQTTDIDSLMRYCQRDTDIITKMFEQWIKFIEINQLGRFGYTLASQSFIAYRTRYMKKKVYIHAIDYITRMEREAYFGGRVEMFFHGQLKAPVVYKLDVNSMYPYVMSKYSMPVKFIKGIEYPSWTKVLYYLQRYSCIAYVAINTNEPVYPVKHKNRLCFPTGRFLTFLSHPELEYAYINRHIEGIRYIILYKKANIFKDFIIDFYNMRKRYKVDNNKVFIFLTKRFMNSLYGKFGQRNDTTLLTEYKEEVKYHNIVVYDVDNDRYYREQWIGHIRKILLEGDTDSNHTFVAIPAMITSLARMHLWKLIKLANVENVFYCDTDSIFCNQAGLDNLSSYINHTELGMLTNEGVTDNCIIHGAKDYQFGDIVRIKGISKTAEKISERIYKQLHFPSFKGDIQHGLDKPYSMVRVEKELKRTYEKGIITESGKVNPLELAEF